MRRAAAAATTTTRINGRRGMLGGAGVRVPWSGCAQGCVVGGAGVTVEGQRGIGGGVHHRAEYVADIDRDVCVMNRAPAEHGVMQGQKYKD